MRRVLLCLLGCVALAASASAESTPDRFGAIALNLQTRGVGISWNFSEEWEARNEALKRCGWGDCKVHLISKNACGVLVVDFAKNIIGVATYSVDTPNSRDKATDRAIYECKSRGGDCRIGINTAWTCAGEPWGRGGTTRFETPEPPKPAPEPSISVQWAGTDAFLVKGANFTPNARVFLKVSGATTLDTITVDFHRRSITARSDGTFTVTTGRVCNTGVPGDVIFIAIDAKKSPTKPVVLRCRAGVDPAEIKIKPKP